MIIIRRHNDAHRVNRYMLVQKLTFKPRKGSTTAGQLFDGTTAEWSALKIDVNFAKGTVEGKEANAQEFRHTKPESIERIQAHNKRIEDALALVDALKEQRLQLFDDAYAEGTPMTWEEIKKVVGVTYGMPRE